MRFLLVAVLLGLVAAASAGRSGREPLISSQYSQMVTHQYESPTWERHILMRNPLPRAVWVYVECEQHLTVNPVGVAGRHTSEIVLPGIGEDEHCLLNHWNYQVNGQSPAPWSP